MLRSLLIVLPVAVVVAGICEEDESWYRADAPSKDCAWVAAKTARCDKVGDDGRAAAEVCVACRTSECGCGVSPWSDFGECEPSVARGACDYDAAVGSWTRPVAARTTRGPVARTEVVRPAGMAAKMAAKAAAHAAASTAARRATSGPASCSGGDAEGFPCSNVDLAAWVELADLPGDPYYTNDLWGWTSATGVEYAIIGCSTGVAFLEIKPDGSAVGVGFLPATEGTRASYWRDIKTYGSYALIVADSVGGSHGMQVFDLTRLEDGRQFTVFDADARYSRFGNAHNVVVNEETGTAYAVGTGSCSGGLYAVSMADPLNPVFAGCALRTYVHDAQCVVYRGPDAEHVGKEICFAFTEDEVRIVDVTDLANAVELASLDYGDVHYAHQGWVDCAQTTLFVDDELDETRGGAPRTKTYVLDVSDLDAPALLFVHEAGNGAIDHNQYYAGGYVFQANYEAGLTVLDPSGARTGGGLVEVAAFDTYPSRTLNGWNGAWSVYPFFASGRVVVNSQSEGVAIVVPTGLRARRRERSIVARAGGGVCPLLVEERACSLGDPAPTDAPAPAPTASPRACADDAAWYSKKPSRGCGWIAKKPAKRCKVKAVSDEGATAFAGCPEACGACAYDCGTESTDWFTKKPSRGCDWVAKKPAARCERMDASSEIDVPAAVACPAACRDYDEYGTLAWCSP